MLLSGLSFCVCAQEVTNNSVHKPEETGPALLESITITADSPTEEQPDVIHPAAVLSRDYLQTRDLRNIGETVSQELGISAGDYGSAAGRPVIRGLSGPRVRILENGIGTMDVSTVSPDHAVATEVLFADQIEIYRGASALLYGSGISGGVVNITNQRIPEQMPDEIGGDWYTHYNSVADDLTSAFRLNAGRGNFAWHLERMHRHTENYSIPGFAQITPKLDSKKGTIENSDVRTKDFSSGLSYIGERGFLGGAVSRFTNHYGVPGSEEMARIDQKQTRFDVKGALDHPLPGWKKMKLHWAHNNHTHKESSNDEDETLLINREWEGRFEMVHQPLGGWEGISGLQYQNRNFSSTGEEAFVPDSRVESLGIFLVEKRNIGRWSIEVGGRYEHQWTKRDEDSFKTNHSAFSIAAGATWQFIEGYSLRGNISHAVRTPKLEELYANGAHLATNSFEIGKTTLANEKNSGIDLSLGKKGGNLDWTLNLFANHVSHFIFLHELDLTGDGQPDRVNIMGIPDHDGLLLLNYDQRNANFIGVEFETIAHLLNNNRNKLDLRLWTDYVRGRLSRGRYLPRMTPLRFGGVLDYIQGPWRGRLDVMRVLKQADTAPLETDTAGYTMLNIQLDYQADWSALNFNLFVRGTNLLNEKARRHTSFLKDQAPLPGRSGLVGIRINF